MAAVELVSVNDVLTAGADARVVGAQLKELWRGETMVRLGPVQQAGKVSGTTPDRGPRLPALFPICAVICSGV